MRFLKILIVFAAWVGPLNIHSQAAAGSGQPASPGAAPDLAGRPSDTLDRARIHGEYGDGNFEIVTQILEEFRSKHRSFRTMDSLFVAKYLGVVYASNPASREKGKYWLYRMLQIDPTSDLVDMYVGEEVDRTFEKVRQEFIVRRNYRGINDVKLAKSIKDGDGRRRDTVVVRDTVNMGGQGNDSMPERHLKDFRFGWTGNINFGVGIKLMDKTQWESTRQQKEFRLALDIRQRRWPINIVLDFLYSRSELINLELADESIIQYRQNSNELNAGVRKIFDQKLYTMRPFVGGGFGYITTALDGFDYQQGTLGAWAEGGIYWELERHFNIGTEFLWSWAEIPYGLGQLANAGGIHFEMILGYHW